MMNPMMMNPMMMVRAAAAAARQKGWALLPFGAFWSTDLIRQQ
jgi:hypothetical protein